MYRDPTPAEYQIIAPRYAAKIGATLTDKQNPEMDLLALAMDFLEIQKRDDFLEHVATTLGTVVYLPYEDIDVLAHELKHVWQYLGKTVKYGPILDATQKAALAVGATLSPAVRDLLERLKIDESRIRIHGLQWAWLYLMSKEMRAIFEAHAYATQMEFQYRRTGQLSKLEDMVDRMRHGYAIDAQEVDDAAKVLEIRRNEVFRHVWRSSVANDGIAILYDVSPELVTYPNAA